MQAKLLFSVLLTFVLATSLASAADTKAADWTLKDLEGKEVKLSDFKGKVVILDFWATWCPPCRKEIPHFVELQKEYGDQGLAIVGISLDEGGAEAVKPFAEKYEINYAVVMGDQEVAMSYGGIEAIPTTFVIDKEGKIVSKHVGYADKETFEKEIKPLL